MVGRMRRYIYNPIRKELNVIYPNGKKMSRWFAPGDRISEQSGQNCKWWLEEYYRGLGNTNCQYLHEICKCQLKRFVLEGKEPDFWDFDERTALYPKDFQMT